MVAYNISIGPGVSIGPGWSLGVTAGPSFSISSADFTNEYFGYGVEGDNTGFSIGGPHSAGEAFYGPQLGLSQGGNPTKLAEILAFWNNNGLTISNNSYMFDVTWGPGSTTNTTRNVVVMSFYYNDTNNANLNIGTVDTNVTGWDTPGQNPFSIAAANGTFMLPATFTLIQPPITDISSWC